jgi:RNA polymerase sigma factor (sigma-70 family)
MDDAPRGPAMTDFELLQQYVRTRAHDAFAELVRRHVDHVYAAALRQTARDGDAAEEVTQRVFILLAQKASQLVAGDPNVLLGGWLFNAVRFIAKDVIRKEERRARHEKKAAEMADHMRDRAERHAAAQPHDPEWPDVERELDEAMAALPEQTRGVLVLRFFEGKSAREVGEQLGISEEAARKRVSRAVDELRARFARRGVVLSVDALVSGLAAVALVKAPAGLAAASASAAAAAAAAVTSTAGTAATATTATAATSSTAAITGGVVMATAKAKTVALIGAVVILTGGAVTVAPKFFSPVGARQVKLAQVGPTITGTVFGPDGKPAANAEVRVGTRARSASAYTGPRDRADGLTDAAGKYAVPKPDSGQYVVVVSSPQGYAEASWKQLARGEQIKLQPWGRIEGVAFHEGKPQPKATVRLWRVGENNEPVSHQTQATADANGRFVFPRVAPGGTQLYLHLPTRSWKSTDWTYVEVSAGKAVNVAIGGRGGRTVVGRVDIPPAMANFVMWKDSGPFTYDGNVRLELDHNLRPKHEKDEAPEEYRAIEEQFARTPEGRRYKEWQFGRNFVVNPDGTFRIDDLPPGKYTATIRHFEEQAEVAFMEDVAKTEVKFEILASPTTGATTQSSADPIDVGTLVPTSLQRVRPGDPAPAFEVKTIDGGTFRSADHKGKPIVVVLWGTYSNTDKLKPFGEFARRWNKDPRVAIIGCYTADNEAEARKHIAEHHLDFPHTADLTLMTKLDSSWPAAVVIGSDGRIVKKHLHDKVLEKYVRQAVGDPPVERKPQSSTSKSQTTEK